MKKFYTLLLCGAVCLSASADGLRFKTNRSKKHSAKARVEAAAAPVWRAESQTDYEFNGEDWDMLGVVTFKYDAKGNITEEVVDADGELDKTVTVYNEYNMPVSMFKTYSDDGEVWENSSMRSYVYDPVVHGFYTERKGYDWIDGEWVKDYYWESNEIVRDDKGNITSMTKYVPLFGGELAPAYKSEWKYGADGKATEYAYYTNRQELEPVWEVYGNVTYKDIVWDKTNGQMTILGDLLELTEGENLLKSAVVYYDGEVDGHYIVEYAADGKGYTVKETGNDVNEVWYMTKFEVIDEYGSTTLTSIEYFDEDGIVDYPVHTLTEYAIKDEHGNYVENKLIESTPGFEEMIDGSKAEYTYDAQGNPTECVLSQFDYDSQEYFYTMRTVYGDYVDVTTGIESVEAESSAVWSVDGDAVSATANTLTGLSVYTLQGSLLMTVPAVDGSATLDAAALSAGMYLVHADGTASTYRLLKR